MKTSDSLRRAFGLFEGGKKWAKGDGSMRGVGCNCALTAVWQDNLTGCGEERYLIKALPSWAKSSAQFSWGFVANYNDDPRCEFRHISALYGKAIKLAEIDEADAAGLTGKARLLRVALALREARNPKFDMIDYLHPCGTPACAFGHYAVRTDLQGDFRVDRDGGRFAVYLTDKGLNLLGYGHLYNTFAGSFNHTTHFEITTDEWDTLFSHKGCAGAKTAIQAADFIEKFAHAKWSTP